MHHPADRRHFLKGSAAAIGTSLLAPVGLAIAKEDGKAWIAGLRELHTQGAFFFSMNRYLFLAQK